VRFAFIEAEKARYPAQLLCRVIDVSKAGFYAWSKRPESGRAIENRRLVTEIHAIHAKSRQTYGSPRVHADLKARGRTVGKNRVARLMSETGAWLSDCASSRGRAARARIALHLTWAIGWGRSLVCRDP
jgi:putative transposase